MTLEKGHILIVDDDQAVLYTAKMILKPYFPKIQTAGNPASGFEYFINHDVDVVLLDMNFRSGATSGEEGIALLKKMIKAKPDVQVITNTAYGDIDLAVQAMKLGAKDFIVKPWNQEKILATVRNAVDLRHSKKELEHVKSREGMLASDIDKASGELLWKDDMMKPIIRTIKKVALTSANVLILGENGTGKELVARAIHKQSHRAFRPFIKVDLGTISETLFESELFGHAKGAFTDAKEEKIGRFEAANGGTVFLDEIGNLNLGMQAKLLTVIQSKQIHRVGSSKVIALDIRWICATNMDLYKTVAVDEFRQDLLYRINTVEIDVPPLRKRVKDIPFLINHFLKEFSHKYQKPGLSIDEQELNKLISYPWPGNIRELQHASERAVILSESKKLHSTDFILKNSQGISTILNKDSLDIKSVEKITIKNALSKTKGNLTNAARELGMGRTTLYRKMKKYNLQP